MNNLEYITQQAAKHKIIAFDMEYDIENPRGGERHYSDVDFELHGVSFGVISDEEEEDVFGIYLTDREGIQYIIDNVFYDKEIECWGHFTKIDYICIKQAGYKLPTDFNIRDTAMALNLFDEERRRYGLKVITPEFLGYDLTKFDEASEKGLDSPEFLQYAMEDSKATLRLALLFKEKLEEYDLVESFDLISPSILVFGDMEIAGVPWSKEASLEFLEQFTNLKSRLRDQLQSEFGSNINLSSPKQLQYKLFKEKAYPTKGLKKTDTGQISTNDTNIEILADRHPVCELILAYRTCEKMLSTYVQTFHKQVHRFDDGRAHGRFGFLLKTGRTSCTDPPLQTLPSKPLGRKLKHSDEIRDEMNAIKLRSGIRPPKGRAFVGRDYSSLEYRTAAVAAPEPKLIAMYKKWDCENCGDGGSTSSVVRECSSCGEPVEQGEDLHNKNKSIANRRGANVTRSEAKELSFLSIFAGSAWKLSQSWNLDIKICEGILNSVFGEFKGFKKWHRKTEAILHKPNQRDGHGRLMSQGEVRDMFGRRRKVNLGKTLRQVRLKAKEEEWDEKTLERKLRGSAKNLLNMLVNFVAQAPACVIGQLAMQEFRKEMIRRDWWMTRVCIINFVHDEILVECDQEIAEEINDLLRHYMETTVDIGVPLASEGGIVYDDGTWADLK